MGLKYRLHPLAAVVALESLKDLKARVMRRREVLTELNRAIENIKGVRAQHVESGVEMGVVCISTTVYWS